MATIYKTNGGIIEIQPKNKKDFKLKEMQDIVGGYIEIVYLEDGRLMVVNEEGKVDGLDVNWNATALVGGYDIIVGDVLVCNQSQIK